MLADNVDRHPALFRTYRAPANQTFNCRVWEAARATTATPTLFEPIAIVSTPFCLKYIDASLGLNNPVRQIRDEASAIFPDRPVEYIISIGSGHPNVIHIQGGGLSQLAGLGASSILKATWEMATDCEEKHNDALRDFATEPNIYFRFNVDQGLQRVGTDEWRKFNEVAAHTEKYLCMQETSHRMALAVQRIYPTVDESGHSLQTQTVACEL